MFLKLLFNSVVKVDGDKIVLYKQAKIRLTLLLKTCK